MIQEELVQLLTNWDMKDCLERFEKERIWKIKTMCLMTEESVKKLFPEEGLRLEFLDQLNNYRDQLNQKSSVESTKNSGNEKVILEDSSSSKVDNNSLSFKHQETSTSEKDVDTSRTRKRTRTESPDLESILRKTINGKLLLSRCEGKDELDESLRNKLGDIIISDFLQTDVNKSLPDDVIERMFENIKVLFPKERKEIWLGFSGAMRAKSQGRGKLLNRFYNMRRSMAKCGLISSKESLNQSQISNTDEEIENIDVKQIENDILWLKNNKEPWSKVLDLWKTTSRLRIKAFKQDKEKVHVYMDMYPGLKDKLGFYLLETDFECMYPDLTLKLYSEWLRLSHFLLSKSSTKEKEEIDECFTADGKMVKTLRLLTNLFPVVTAFKKGKSQWRPSRQEAKDSIILVVPTVADIQPELQIRREKYAKYDLSLGPQVVIVGEADAPEAFYFVINHLMYEVESALKAVDLTFKSMQALDTVYPKEGQREWLFLQRAVYGFENAFDKRIIDSRTNNVIEEFKSYKISTTKV